MATATGEAPARRARLRASAGGSHGQPARGRPRSIANLQTAGSIDLEAIRAALPAGRLLLEYYRVARHASRLPALPRQPEDRAGGVVRRSCAASCSCCASSSPSSALARTTSNSSSTSCWTPPTPTCTTFYRAVDRSARGALEAAGHLIIAPHDFLHYLPFHALTEAGGLWTSASPSLTRPAPASITSARPSRRRAGGIAGAGDSRSGGAPDLKTRCGRWPPRSRTAEVFVGADATAEVLRERGAHSRFVHIATHGSFRQDNPMFSSISLGIRSSTCSTFTSWTCRPNW